MSKFKNQYFLSAVLCATTLLNSELSQARNNMFSEESYSKLKSGISRMPSLKGDRIAESLEEQNLMGSSHKSFGIKPAKNEWENKEPQGQNQSQKYNLVGVALFSGKDPVSYGIKAITGSKISHIGIILSDANDENKKYCFESTGSASEVMKGRYPHVRITPWNTVINSYNGKVYSRTLELEDKDMVSTDIVTDFVNRYDQISYTKNPLRLAKSLFNKNHVSKSYTLKTAFCSELAAKMFMDLGLLKNSPAGNYIPRDFIRKNKLSFVSGVSLGPVYKEK